MSGFSRFRTLVISVTLLTSFCLSSLTQAGDGGHAQAEEGSKKASILPIIGVATVAIGVAMVASQNYYGYAVMVMGALEIAGGMAASDNNAKTAAQLAGAGFTAPTGYTPPDMDMEKLCQGAGALCSCSGTSCSHPNIQNIPSLNEIKAGLTRGFKNNPNAFPAGYDLDDALAKLDNNYSKANEAINNFNNASAAGAFDPNASKSLVADEVKTPGGINSKSDKEDPTKISNSATTLVAGADDPSKEASALGIGLGNFKRDLLHPVTRVRGINLEDSTSGRLLTLFERVSRAIRGEHDRDITLAKVEWVRKDLAQKEKRRLKDAKSATVGLNSKLQ